jgi:hypothetical protein
VVLTSCEKTVFLDTDQADVKIVIEGMLTNRDNYHYVKISRSADFYDSGKTPRVTDAIVTVNDDQGNTFEFIHNPNDHPDSAGFYLPASSFAGVVGRTYTLNVVADGKGYTAADKMYSVTAIDSLTYGIDQDEMDDPEEEGKYYEVLIYAVEPQDTKDYYLFDFYRNDSLLVAEPDEIYFSDDVALGEEINGVQSPIYYAKGDVARVEAFSLSRAGYVFYSDLQGLLRNDGGMYSPPPANCRTNLSDGALGFFRVSAVDMMEIKIE